MLGGEFPRWVWLWPVVVEEDPYHLSLFLWGGNCLGSAFMVCRAYQAHHLQRWRCQENAHAEGSGG